MTKPMSSQAPLVPARLRFLRDPPSMRRVSLEGNEVAIAAPASMQR